MFESSDILRGPQKCKKIIFWRYQFLKLDLIWPQSTNVSIFLRYSPIFQKQILMLGLKFTYLIFDFWGPAHGQFWKFCKINEIFLIEIKSYSYFLVHFQNPWQLDRNYICIKIKNSSSDMIWPHCASALVALPFRFWPSWPFVLQ